MQPMPARLSIGEFSRMTHLSVKALRHYHEQGILEPHVVDNSSGYRYYDLGQLPDAHVIRRLRDLDMPLDDVRDVLGAQTTEARSETISRHLTRMEAELARTRTTVTSLRELLTGESPVLDVVHRSIESSVAAVRRGEIGHEQTDAWFGSAFRDLEREVRRSGHEPTLPSFALFSAGFFNEGSGPVVAAVAVRRPADHDSGLLWDEIDGGDYAVVTHSGSYEDLDRAYAALGAYVIRHGISADGPIRENYLVGPDLEADPLQFRTEICWPIEHGA